MAALDPEEKLAWLRLARCPGVGPVGFQSLIERFGSARAALGGLPTLQRQPAGRPPSAEAMRAEMAAVAARGAHLLARAEPLYPELLRNVADAPAVITVDGAPKILARPAVAVVGARNASANGCALARAVAAELAAAGLVVVSGLARGIDTAAHEGALSVSGLTAAVIASGLDLVWPPDNADLQARIAAEGAVVSERPLGAEARAKDFPRRNRIIAGLAAGVVVIEAAPQSGSLITARLAAEQGREVMAVPGSPMDPRHRGTNQLLREGATLVESAEDVLEALRPLMHRPPRRSRPAPPPPPSVPPAPDAASGALASLLGPEPILVDELVRQSGLPAAAVQDALLDLELEGRLERHPGGKVSMRVDRG